MDSQNIFTRSVEMNNRETYDYRGLFENMRLGIAVFEVIYDASQIPVNHRLLIANRPFEHLTEAERSEESGRASEHLSLLCTDEIRTQCYWIAEQGGNLSWVYSGTAPELHCDVRVFSPSRGQFALIVNDITEQKCSEKVLQQSSLLLNSSQHLNKVGGWEFDVATGRAVWTEGVYKIHELPVGAEIDHVTESLKCYRPEDREIIALAFKRATEEGKAYDLEFSFTTFQGKALWVRTTCQPIYENGQVVRLIGNLMDITDYKQVENELRKSQAAILDSELRYKALVEQAVDGIFLADAQGIYIDVNVAGCNMLGYARDELLKLTLVDILDPSEIPRLAAQLDSLATGEPGTSEWRFLRKDGSTFLGELRGKQLANGNFQGHVSDISERKRAEQRLAYSEALFHALFNTIASGVAVYEAVNDGEDFIFKDFNRAAELLEQCTREDVLNKRVTQCFPGVKEFGLFAVLQRVWKTGVAEYFPINLYRDSRLLVWRENQVYRLPSGEVVAVYEDVTTRKEAEERLRVAAVAFETHECIMITDASANIIKVNQAFQKVTGYSAEEVLGKNPRMLASGLQDKEFYREMWQQLVQKGSWTGEIWDKRKNGQLLPKLMTITAVKDASDQISEYVAIFTDITERKQAEAEIRNLAFYDVLTQLPNRRLLRDRLQSALLMSVRSAQYGAVLFLDLDKFKILNDTLGHDSGDLLLVEVAARIKACVREVDTVARLGGDEFVVLLEGVDASAEAASQKVAQVAEKIRASLAAPYQLKEHLHHSSPSIGVCLYCGNQESVDHLLKHADMAMYQAKGSGRNTVRFFDPAMQLAVEAHAGLEADLRHAIVNQELQLYYQVQVDAEHHLLGAEALVRWIHPTRGLILPGQFIPIAEESSLILEVGAWVLRAACRQLSLWAHNALTRELTVAVNVSAKQLRHNDFVETVRTVLNEYGVAPARLKLELTESELLIDVTDAIAKMQALRTLGVNLSMDDFGTGYSSLSYLKNLPLNQLKIDQSFVRDIATDSNDAVMVKTIIDLAHNFRLNVIAEGVETEAQLMFLQKHHCSAYQGYFFGRPVPLEQFEAQLQSVGLN